AVQHGITCITTLSAAAAVVNGVRAQREHGIQVFSLQQLHGKEPGSKRPAPGARNSSVMQPE
ncbi:MAG: hypothetical protein ACRD2P_12185, partial [Terriglobia bacterium]